MNNIWLGTENGIFIYDQTFRLVTHYQQSESDLSNLNDSPIYSLLKITIITCGLEPISVV